MWQRIQTLYLAIASGLILYMFFGVMAVAIGTDGQTAEIHYSEKLPYLCLMISLICANLLALVLFKYRPLQLRVAVIAALLLIGFQIWIAIDYFNAPDGIVFKFTAIFPIIAAILDFMAVKGIYADQLMVESFSRLRSSKKHR